MLIHVGTKPHTNVLYRMLSHVKCKTKFAAMYITYIVYIYMTENNVKSGGNHKQSGAYYATFKSLRKTKHFESRGCSLIIHCGSLCYTFLGFL